MLRISLLIAATLSLFGFRQEFESKQDAIDFLNNANIWIAGMPEFVLDEREGMLNVILKSENGSATASLPLAKMQTEFVTGNIVTVEINCKNAEFCALAATGRSTVETDGLTLVMRSTFDDGTYHDRYLEQGAKVANALDYLISFYKE